MNVDNKKWLVLNMFPKGRARWIPVGEMFSRANWPWTTINGAILSVGRETGIQLWI